MLDVTCDHLLQSVSSGYQVAAHLLIDVTCNEACSACSGLATSSANPTGASGASPAASDAAAAPMEEDNSAQLLGLPEVDPGNQPKKRRLSAPKVKKSREEIFQDEVDKIRAKYEELLANMRDPTAQMPTPAATAKVQRILSAKLVESKEQWGCFESSPAVQRGPENDLCIPPAQLPSQKGPWRWLCGGHGEVVPERAEALPRASVDSLQALDLLEGPIHVRTCVSSVAVCGCLKQNPCFLGLLVPD